MQMNEGLEGGCKEGGARLFPVVPSARTRDCGHKLEPRRFPLSFRRPFFTMRVPGHGCRLPRGAVESPSVGVFRSHLDAVLGS